MFLESDSYREIYGLKLPQELDSVKSSLAASCIKWSKETNILEPTPSLMVWCEWIPWMFPAYTCWALVSGCQWLKSSSCFARSCFFIGILLHCLAFKGQKGHIQGVIENLWTNSAMCVPLKVNALCLDSIKACSYLHRKHFTMFWSVALVLHNQQLSADLFFCFDGFYGIRSAWKNWANNLHQILLQNQKIGCRYTWTLKRGIWKKCHL